MDRKAIEKDPFRVFFPLGIIFGMAGILPWTAVFWNQAVYPLAFHKAMMMNGFLLTFVAGFLMTAVPRFTSTAYASFREIAFVWTCLLGSALASMTGAYASHHALASVALLGVMTFAVKRFTSRQSNPPGTFIFVGTGLGFWLLANLIFTASSMQLLASSPLEIIAREIFNHGAILGLIIGIGSRLIPGILGWTEIVSQQKQTYEQDKPFVQVIPGVVWMGLLLFWASYLFSPALPDSIKVGARFLIVLFFALKFWKIHRLPKTRGYLQSSIWLSSLCLILGFLLQLIWPQGGTHALHILLIGGFTLLTLMVASRVTLAHSAGGTAQEASMTSLSMLAAALLLAMVFRVSAILFPNHYLQLLGVAALIFVLSLVAWLLLFLRRLIRPL
jgi:uncharacterized protein involved in response to NO